MKVLVLTSGGDASGMNYFLYCLSKDNKNKYFASIGGYRGLVQNDIVPLDKKQACANKDFAGTFIKTARCDEFATAAGLQKAINNIKNGGFDCVVVVGGDGTFCGCKTLSQSGINCIFVPATVDKDLPYKTYSIGFDTAVSACCDFVQKVMYSVKSFDRSAVFEVMGRDNNAICTEVAKKVNADYAVDRYNLDKIDFKGFANKNSKIVILQEKMIDLYPFCEKLSNIFGCEVRGYVVGYLQRSEYPTKTEKRFCKILADNTKRLLTSKKFGVAIALDEQKSKCDYKNIV